MMVQPVNPELPYALATALDDEYRARATYQAVVDTYGPVLPFSNIVHAEERHISALVSLFQRYGLVLPADRWAGNVVPRGSLLAECEAAVEGEIRNYQMYDQLLTRVSEPDVHRVFSNLRNASAYHHLPAFQACTAALSGQNAIPVSPAPGDANAADHVMAAVLGMAAGAGLIWVASRVLNRAGA